MRVKDGERGREKEGKLDGVEKRGLGRCFSVHPLLPSFSLASILSMLFLFLALLSLSLSSSLLPYSKYVDIRRGIFRIVKKKKKNTQTKVVGTNIQENLAN